MDLFLQDPSPDSSTESVQYGNVSPSSNTLSGTSLPQDHGGENDTSEKKRGRKGRTKSRTGCFNCKRARIKCKENRPICDYCLHRDLSCEWPDLRIVQAGTVVRRHMAQSGSLVSKNPQLPMPVFTMQDFRLFNHFIQNAYPHHPIGDDAVWTHEIPSISSNHQYLLHAMLALSASDLACSKRQVVDRPQLTSVALAHRVKAISALNNAISTGIDGFEAGNAMVATCFALVFQSTLINDGLSEYMTFIRGTLAISIQLGMRKMKILFKNLFGNEGFNKVDSAVSATPPIKAEIVAGCCRSFEQFAHLCQSKTEIEVYTLLVSTARSLTSSYRDAYLNLQQMYRLFSFSMPQDEFREFTDPRNEVCRLLQAHFVALQLIMTPITQHEWDGRENNTETGNGFTGCWLTGLHCNIPESMREYYEWTMWVEQEVYHGRVYNSQYAEDISDISEVSP